jgi:hypothetical protein
MTGVHAIPAIEKAEMELNYGIGCSKCGVEVSARQAEICTHHAVTNRMASVENCEIVRSISCVLGDIENLRACPSMLRDHLKKVSQ